ncbi:MsnO8 family LLM class oxidoreductase [Microvirga calopogonii]|uniref:MsnO8 family LLM class oxidoreductase n=1 Tax=Microvirga calopogonii TaxID=2078013 RepID=UPI000E0D0305|nr:MsnO8 family LLM class oxidoreductase [Microvirga calopogonii]
MNYRLGLLDKSPLASGDIAENALARTIDFARHAEALGYHRFWVAEHHGFPGLASSAPELLAAFVIARTTRIRVGSGGVLLQHYSPYKVAESFNLLAALAPGRVDLGVGKAPGGFPLSTKALGTGRSPTDFADELALLDVFLNGGPPEGHPLHGAVAKPTPTFVPERFLLGASSESALLAAKLGWAFVYAGHLNGDRKAMAEILTTYRQASDGQAPILALAAFAARTSSEAERHVADLKIVRVELDTGQSVNLGTEEQAAEFARQAGAASYRIEERRPRIVAGTPAQVRRELDQLSREFGIREFILDTPVASAAERFTSIELLAAESPAAAA